VLAIDVDDGMRKENLFSVEECGHCDAHCRSRLRRQLKQLYSGQPEPAGLEAEEEDEEEAIAEPITFGKEPFAHLSGLGAPTQEGV
jgi:hypothetical protein